METIDILLHEAAYLLAELQDHHSYLLTRGADFKPIDDLSFQQGRAKLAELIAL